MIGLGLRITSGAVRNALPGIAAPALSLTGGTIDSPRQPQLNTGAFTLENGAVDTHASTDWQIATDAAFTTIVWSALGSLSLTQITVGLALSETTTYYARARHNGATYQSKYNAAVMFNTLTVFVTAPLITSPADLATGIGATPAITSSAFAVTNGSDTHASSDWQIASDAGFTTIVAQSLADATNLESWAVPAGNLVVSTTYYLRVRHTGTAEGASAYSSTISFTTASSFVPLWPPITGAVYANKTFSTTAQLGGNMTDVQLSSDGSTMYAVRWDTGTVYQYSLSIAGDINTAVYANKSFTTSGPTVDGAALYFSPDGTKMYIGGESVHTVYQYALNTPGDVSTAVYTGKSLLIANETSLEAIHFSTDGMNLYAVGANSRTVYQYGLTTAYDLATATDTGKSMSVSAHLTAIAGLHFSTDGTRAYVAGWSKNAVYQYNLTTPWDVLTGSYANLSIGTTTQPSSPQGLTFGPGGVDMYVSDVSAIYQYVLA